MKIRIEISGAGRAPKKFSFGLTEGVLLRLGRHTAHFDLDDPSVEALHCVLAVNAEELFVTAQANAPVTLNGAAIQRSRLVPGDILVIGDFTIHLLSLSVSKIARPIPKPQDLDEARVPDLLSSAPVRSSWIRGTALGSAAVICLSAFGWMGYQRYSAALLASRTIATESAEPTAPVIAEVTPAHGEIAASNPATPEPSVRVPDFSSLLANATPPRATPSQVVPAAALPAAAAARSTATKHGNARPTSRVAPPIFPGAKKISRLTAHAASLAPSPFFGALAQGNLAMVRDWVTHHSSSPNLPAPNGILPLAVAASQGSGEMVTYLLSQGAHVNGTDRLGRNAIFYAAKTNHLEAARILVRAGSNLLLKDARGKRALDYARVFTQKNGVYLAFVEKSTGHAPLGRLPAATPPGLGKAIKPAPTRATPRK